MADANGVADGLEQFELWYLQAGTPEIVASPSFDAATGTYTLLLEQSCAPTPVRTSKPTRNASLFASVCLCLPLIASDCL